MDPEELARLQARGVSADEVANAERQGGSIRLPATQATVIPAPGNTTISEPIRVTPGRDHPARYRGPLDRLGDMASDAWDTVTAPVRRALAPAPPQRVVPETTGMARGVARLPDAPAQYISIPDTRNDLFVRQTQDAGSVGTPRDMQPLRRLEGPHGLAVVADPETGILERDTRTMADSERERVGQGRRAGLRAESALGLGYDPDNLTIPQQLHADLWAMPDLARRYFQGDAAMYAARNENVRPRTGPPQSVPMPEAPPDNLLEEDRLALQGVMNAMHDGEIGLEEARSVAQRQGRIIREYQGTFDERAFLDELERIARVREGAEQRRTRSAQRNRAGDARARENIRNRR